MLKNWSWRPPTAGGDYRWGFPPKPPTPTQALFRGPNKQGLWELEKMRPAETELGLRLNNVKITKINTF